MVEKICPDCGAKFNYEPNPNFPDKRKYCDSCGAKRKASWDASQQQASQQKASQPAQQATLNQQPPILQGKSPAQPQQAKHIVINRVEKPHSYEFGKAGARHKVYYSEVSELLGHIAELKRAQLFAEVVFEAE